MLAGKLDQKTGTHACRRPILSWMELWELPMRQKMPPKIMALDTLLAARPTLVALSLLTWRLHVKTFRCDVRSCLIDRYSSNS